MTDKIYIVSVETNEDGDFSEETLGNRYYTDRDEARRAMCRDFNDTKADFDECDDTDEYHELDHCCISANMEWTRSWNVVELRGEAL